MELDWSTTILEIINFLVLVWILTRFLYRPVLEVVARRRAGIEEALARSEAAGSQAQSLKREYESRLADLERERAAAREVLRAELDAERNRQMAELQASLAQAREKARVAEERRLEEALRRNEEVAVARSARFAAKLLGALAGAELEERLAALTLSELTDLPAERRETLRGGEPEGARDGQVLSSRTLDPATRENLENELQKTFGAQLRCRFGEDPSLIAGLRITVGAWVLNANIRDELKGFAELSHGSTGI